MYSYYSLSYILKLRLHFYACFYLLCFFNSSSLAYNLQTQYVKIVAYYCQWIPLLPNFYSNQNPVHLRSKMPWNFSELYQWETLIHSYNNQRMDYKTNQFDRQFHYNVCPQGLNNVHPGIQGVEGDAYQFGFQNKTGHWTLRQNAKYYAFLKMFKQKFSQRQSRRQCKVFKALAQFIKTRNANQCRSHHHKMQKNFQTIQQNLNQLLKKNPNLEQKCRKYFTKLQKIESSIFGVQSQQKNQKIGNQQNLKDFQNPNHFYSLINTINQFKDPKKNQNQVLRTAASYQNQVDSEADQIEHKNHQSPEKSNIYANQLHSYTGKTQSSYRLQNEPIESLKFSKSNFNINYYNKLMQCQEYFVRWYNKVGDIVRREEQQLKMMSFENWSNPNQSSFYY